MFTETGCRRCKRFPENEPGTAPSLHPLSNLFGAEGADAIQTKRKNDSIFITQAHVEGKILGRDHAAFPRVTDRRRRTDQSAITAGKRMFLKIKKQRNAAEQSSLVIAEKNRRAPL